MGNRNSKTPLLLKELREINNELSEMLVSADQMPTRRAYKKLLSRIACFVEDCERTVRWGEGVFAKGKPRYSKQTLRKINDWMDTWVDIAISIMQEYPIEKSIFTPFSIIGKFFLFKTRFEINDRDLPNIPPATYTRKRISAKKYIDNIKREYSESDLPVYSSN